MTEEKKSSEKAPRVTGVPPLAEEVEPKAGPGQKVVESPIGSRSVVDEDAVALLKTQGYKVLGG